MVPLLKSVWGEIAFLVLMIPVLHQEYIEAKFSETCLLKDVKHFLFI